jgi:hypothetical protein
MEKAEEQERRVEWLQVLVQRLRPGPEGWKLKEERQQGWQQQGQQELVKQP